MPPHPYTCVLPRFLPPSPSPLARPLPGLHPPPAAPPFPQAVSAGAWAPPAGPNLNATGDTPPKGSSAHDAPMMRAAAGWLKQLGACLRSARMRLGVQPCLRVRICAAPTVNEQNRNVEMQTRCVPAKLLFLGHHDHFEAASCGLTASRRSNSPPGPALIRHAACVTQGDKEECHQQLARR